MDLLDAVERVLMERGVPMPIDSVARIVLSSGMWSSKGKKPKMSVTSRIYSDMKREGESSRFVKFKSGVIDLRAGQSLFPEGLFYEGVSSVRSKAALKGFIKSMDALSPEEFESAVKGMMEAEGIAEIEKISRRKRDEANFAGYINIFGSVSIRVRVLAARWKSGAVCLPAIERVRRDLAPGDRGIIFSTRGFSREAARAAQTPGMPPVALFGAEEMEKFAQGHA